MSLLRLRAIFGENITFSYEKRSVIEPGCRFRVGVLN